MVNFDSVTKKSIKKHNPNWLQISYHPYRILIVAVFGSGKTNPLNQIQCNKSKAIH